MSIKKELMKIETKIFAVLATVGISGSAALAVTGGAVSILGVSMLKGVFGYIVAVALMFLTLRARDRVIGIEFKGWIGEASDTAKAIYFGAWVIGLCYVLSSVLV